MKRYIQGIVAAGPGALFEILLSSVLIVFLVFQYTGLFAQWGMAVLIIVAAIIGTAPVIYGAVRDLMKREWASMDMLASIALLFSLFSAEWASSVFIALMLSAARLLSVITESRAEKNIESLLALRPDVAKVERGARVEVVSLEALVQGDVVIVDVGDRIPVDGIVLNGEAAVDESSLTGESLPVDKEIGSNVFSSTLVSSGGMRITAKKVGKDTTLEKIIELVKSSTEQRSKITTLGERFGKMYLIGILVLAGGLLYFTHNTNLVLAVVLVVCADDVAIAVPLAFLGAIGSAAKRGIIIKGSAHLEALGRAPIFVFDKTGTLTKGAVQVAGMHPALGVSEADLLQYAALVARGSKHPLSLAIAAYAQELGAPLIFPDSSNSIGGKGVVAQYQGVNFIMGNIAFIESEGIPIPKEVLDEASRLGGEGKSISIVARDGVVLGVVGLHDEMKGEAKDALRKLRALGVARIIMLTGDSAQVAQAVSDQIGITEFYAGLLPEEKVARINLLKKEGEVVMVGDGVNDAAALLNATVGVAMGKTGFDTTIESADVVLMTDDLMKLVDAVKLARHVDRISKQDFVIWGGTNMLGLALVFSGIIGPAGAAAYNFISDFFPLGNSLRAWEFESKRRS